MKRVVCLIAFFAVVLGLACPVFAAEDGFVPSISYKGAPEIVGSYDPEGKPILGSVKDKEGKVIKYVYEPCLVITPVSEAKTSAQIPDAAEELLLSVYDRLANGTMTIPYEKHDEALKGKELVIRDLFDVSWLCSDHPVIVAEPGVTVELTFDLGVKQDAEVYCMTYKNNEWNPIVSLVNNGDGTVTCVFEDFCPVEFSVVQKTPPVQTGDRMDVTLWVAVLTVSAAALVVLLISKRNCRFH